MLPEALPSGQALLDLLDLLGVHSRLIGGIRELVANSKGLLSVLAPTTVSTRGELVESIERQLSRPFGQDLNVANAFLNVTQTRATEALRRGLTVYGEGRIPKRGLEVLFGCEPSELRARHPSRLKTPRPIASSDSAGLLEDLQNRGSIVFCDRFFDAKGNNPNFGSGIGLGFRIYLTYELRPTKTGPPGGMTTIILRASQKAYSKGHGTLHCGFLHQW